MHDRLARGRTPALRGARTRGHIGLRLVLTSAIIAALAVFLPAASASAATPPGVVNPCTGKQIFFFFRYNDSATVGVDQGCSTTNDVLKTNVPTLVATKLHVSCSDDISPEGVPTKSILGDPNRRVAAYFIQKPDGKTCGFGNPAEEPKTDVKIVKTASATVVNEGEQVTYTLSVSNVGTTDAHDVLVSDVLPAGVTFVSASAGCTYNAANRTVSCDAGDLLVGGGTPTDTCTGEKEIYYNFQYNDSATVGTDVGCSTTNDVLKTNVPSLVATKLHVSCSDTISPDGVPTKAILGDPNRRITAYFIQKADGKTCGQGTFTPPSPPTFTITVVVNESHCNTATVGMDETDDNPADNTSTVCVDVRTQTISGQVYLCINGVPSTQLVGGATIAVPAAGISGGNPLATTPVPAASYAMNATVPSTYKFVACGQSGVTIGTPTSATQTVVVPPGGNGNGIFYATAQSFGYIEVCKSAANGVTGNFTFVVEGKSYTVPAGACTSAIKVVSGNVTVTEKSSPYYVMQTAYTTPSDRLISKSTSSRTATVKVVTGGVSTQTIVTFVNKPVQGTVKVCQVAGPGVAQGTSFQFSNSANSSVVSVPAGPAPGGYCVVLPGTYTGGTELKITQAPGSTIVTSIKGEPADRLIGSSLSSKWAKVKVGSGVTEVTFTNKAGY